MSLTAILQDKKSVPFCYIEDGIHVCGMTIEMDRNNSFDLSHLWILAVFLKNLFNVARIHGEGLIDIDENRSASHMKDRFHGWKSGQGRDENGITWSDSQGF